ncbi:RagB/SusD family nutrient uptake outer membrane protein [Rubrivirga sp.]|uniref:RagB/SusD family nutrient uptake outer membrane protein n=1 Tax=Rubrivirga sp. TaxID=1885344 RepID=UPI003B528A0B
MTRLRSVVPVRLALALCAALAVAGCDSILDTEPLNVQTFDNQLASPEGAVGFVNSLYGALPGLYNGAIPNLVESGTDDGWPFAQSFQGLKTREIDATQGQLGNVWTPSLTEIASANYYLNREPSIDFGDDDDLKDQLRGEALFLRAFYYFNLVRLFGEVPIYDESVAIDQISEAQRPRDSVADVYAFIKRDLGQAIELLPASYTDSGLAQERGRATSGAARTLLAKVHLTLEEWSDVLAVTDGITGYSLRPSYIDNFYGLLRDASGENRVESIFEVQYSQEGDGPKSFIRVAFTPRGIRDGQNQILPTDDAYPDFEVGAGGPNAIIQAYGEGDARFDVVFDKFGASRGAVTESYGSREWFVQKWYSDIGNNATSFNIVVFRYAEVLLMRAEALAELGRPAEAIPLVNQIRARAGVDALGDDVDDQGEVRQAVRLERRLELAFEFKRLFDLNRWGILTDVLAPQGITINPAKVTAHPITGKPEVLYPIPLGELQRNPNATQNAGY